MKNKIAIRVNNKREFDYLMKHYENKGWVSTRGIPASKWRYDDHAIVDYHNNFDYTDRRRSNPEIPYQDYTILDFPTFAQIAGIEVVNEVVITMTSSFEAIVSSDRVDYKQSKDGKPHGPHYITGKELEEIYAAYKSLQ